VLLPRVDAEYEICNWYTASHPDSPYRSNLIAARPGPGKTRITLFNARLNVRHANGQVERRTLADIGEYREVLTETFGLALSDADLAAALETVTQKGARRTASVFFIDVAGSKMPAARTDACPARSSAARHAAAGSACAGRAP
jgi:N-hydroxyarylamine O-acetyltransferase